MSNPTIKDGKKPISERVTTPDPAGTNFFGGVLDVDQVLKAELEAKGLEYRWVDAKKALSSDYLRNGWTPYLRAPQASKVGLTDFKLGTDPTGLIRRDSVVLATRPKAVANQHRQLLQAKAARQSVANHQKAKADELKQSARGSGMKTVIHEGYEEQD